MGHGVQHAAFLWDGRVVERHRLTLKLQVLRVNVTARKCDALTIVQEKNVVRS
jgi:hypothetical protein